ncbi:hypothetical protein [Janibacter alittae]|uniref:Uncharacterized protein n=1 Tax=Janibacter alittae TaxID=3115209 RepID=A0ABZ2MJ81_9MICO
MSGPVSVALFADPGLPARLVDRILAKPSTSKDGEQYELLHRRRQIPLREDGTLDLDEVRGWSRDEGTDVTVIITEIPRLAGRRTKMTAVHFAERLIVISLPALGGFRLEAALRRALYDSLDLLLNQQDTDEEDCEVSFGVVHEQRSKTGRSLYTTSSPWSPAHLRLVLGMVRTNEPLLTAPTLSGVLAAAGATGAFGIFYSSIWRMAEALPSWRLMLITGMSIAAMAAWLIFSNHLWEPRGKLGSLAEATHYNISTITTLLVSVTMLYLALFFGILTAAAVVIDANFMATTIGKQVSMWNYVDIAWLSASMGTVAGALGSNFDSEVDVRNLTNGRRQAMRYWQKRDTDEDAPGELTHRSSG